jgi:hypothetical protein
MSHHRRVAFAPRMIVTALYLAVHAACSTVDGGAVELSWRLKPTSGAGTSQPFIDCASKLPGTGPVTGIRLDWQVGSDHAFAVFDCSPGHGITRFEVPPGQALLSVSPVCASGPADPSTYTAPAPEQRTVTVGNTVTLGAVELVLTVTNCDLQPCICQ